MWRILGLVCLLGLGSGFVYAADELTYSAAVVEISTEAAGDTVAMRVSARLKKIVDQINLNAHRSVDIIVFPENALTEASAQTVPSPAERVVLCGNTTYTENLLQSVSCAARSASTYVVINALTHHNCTEEQLANTEDNRPCAASNLNVYNTNIVFDRTGAVISIYRKYNAYDGGVNVTLTADTSTFDTDFGVKFGHLISNDILFEEPTASLMQLGVRNFVYPTEWYSGLPFLTAIQLQQNWAHANNVNLLAAGISDPQVGSTGSGIYSGTQGALASHFSATRFDLPLVHTISKTPAANVLPSLPMPVATPIVTLMRDQLDNYTNVKLNITESSQHITLCHGSEFCCDFRYWLEEITSTTNTLSYEYVAAVYNGTRTFGRNPKEEKVVSCSVFTCLDASNIATCGVISNSTMFNRYRFKELNISGRFRHSQTLVIPTTLAIGLVPLPVANFMINSTEPVELSGPQYKNVSISLVRFEQHLLTFGVWGRDYSVSSSAIQCSVGVLMVIVSGFVSFMI